MNNRSEAATIQYIIELKKKYEYLLRILEIEADDIASDDETSLSFHVAEEHDTVKLIVSLTKTVQEYIKHVALDDYAVKCLAEIHEMKKTAEVQSAVNIERLRASAGELKTKINSIKLPKSARRVYYSGNNPTLMDIEV